MFGKIFDIQRFSVHDGPGIRTTVFMKGCNLRCKWCHNPEGLIRESQIRFFAGFCVNCKQCSQVCKNSVHVFEKEESKHTVLFDKCLACKKCIDVCPANALEFSGTLISAEELVNIVEADSIFYGKKGEYDAGGVAFSGGEPLLQADFIAETEKLLRRSGKTPSVSIDTSGYVSYSEFLKVLPYTDYFLYDLKAYDTKIHKMATGVDNSEIFSNLIALDKDCTFQKIYIRIPVIPDVNDSEEEMEKLSQFVCNLRNVEQVTLIPYHSLGKEKYQQIGLSYTFDFSKKIETDTIRKFADIFNSKGILVKN